MAGVTAGVSIALTGRLERQGREALDGLRLWADDVGRAGGLVVGPGTPPAPLRLIVLDDRSRREQARENVRRLLDEHRADVLLGPYGSHLVLAVAPIVDERGGLLWNHGGSADALWEGGGHRVVSAASPASDYFRALPSVLRGRDPRLTRIIALYHMRGVFAPAVARGLAEGAAAAGCEPAALVPFTPAEDMTGLLDRAAAADPHLLVAAGSFSDDVEIVRRRRRLPAGTRLAVVAAGLAAFGDEVGEAADGVIGPSQWEPEGRGADGEDDAPRIGPDREAFLARYRGALGGRPGYVAAQAYAVGLVAAECVRQAGTLRPDDLLPVAGRLDTTTFFGRFRLDPATLRQVGHRVLLVEWRRGRKVVLDG
jgi:branched-chain amino acid transport system substrate-binding protein